MEIHWQMLHQHCLQGHLSPLQISEKYQIPEQEVIKQLSSISSIDIITLQDHPMDLTLIKTFSIHHAKQYTAIPFKFEDGYIHIASLNPFNPIITQIAQKAFKDTPIKLYFSTQYIFDKLLERIKTDEWIEHLAYTIIDQIKQQATTPKHHSSAITQLIEAIIKEALHLNASDIHIESSKESCVIRLRIDGVLLSRFSFDQALSPILSSQLKFLSKTDITEKRKAQDGSFTLDIQGRKVDLRLSTLPILYGESLVLRIINVHQSSSLESLGFESHHIKILQENIQKTHGIFFIVGATGSGKTTTLYTLLRSLNPDTIKIITIEDPIEHPLKGISQVIINEKIDFGFPQVLKNILRQDPDVIIVGETRDQETLRLSFEASLTGHLVGSTLHTQDALSSITRLLDMGIESYFLASCLQMILAQKLVKKLCPHCKYPYSCQSHHENLPTKNQTFYHAKGCIHCHQRGFLGRELIIEILNLSPALKNALHHKASHQELYELARKEGFISFKEAAFQKALEGKIALEEVYCL